MNCQDDGLLGNFSGLILAPVICRHNHDRFDTLDRRRTVPPSGEPVSDWTIRNVLIPSGSVSGRPGIGTGSAPRPSLVKIGKILIWPPYQLAWILDSGWVSRITPESQPVKNSFRWSFETPQIQDLFVHNSSFS